MEDNIGKQSYSLESHFTEDVYIYKNLKVLGNLEYEPILNLVSVNENATDVFLSLNNSISAINADQDKIVFWNTSSSKLTYLSLGSNISITNSTLNVPTGAGGVTDVTAVQTSYSGISSITVSSPSSGVRQINISSSSNAYGKKFIHSYSPTTEGNNGDIWYQITA